MKLKARSRLQPKNPYFNFDSIDSDKLPFLKLVFWKTQFISRQSKIPQLIISLVAYLASWYLMNHYYPIELKNFLWPGSYLSLISLLAIGHLYLLSFLTLKPRLALFSSLSLSWILWLKLHQFELNFPIISLSLLSIFWLNWVFSLSKS